MYRPVQNSVKPVLFSQRNYDTLETVLVQDFQRRNSAPLNDQQRARLSKTLDHYLREIYEVQGEQPIQTLNKEVLSACAKDFSKYIERKEITRNTSSVKTVMDESLFQETSQRFEKLTQDRNEVKALPPAVPNFRISLNEDSPSSVELYELAKKNRELEALRSAQANTELVKADVSMQRYVSADSSFHTQNENMSRMNELALVQRQNRPRDTTNDMPLVVMPDRRELMLAPIGSFSESPMPRDLGNANSNPTIIQPTISSPDKNNLPQNYVVREDKVVSYKEVENNLFIYSGDRDWLRNNKENRYNFTVNFDPANNGLSFGPSPASQQKFKNIVRIEFIKAIMPCEGLDVLVRQTIANEQVNFNTNFQDNILNFPFLTVRVAELENNNFGTDNFLDRSFGVVQYDANWNTDTVYDPSDTNNNRLTKGYVAMIPKFLKCEKVYHPTPLSTLQKMTIDIHRPNGEIVSTTPDTLDILGVIGSNWIGTGSAPYDVDFAPSSFFTSSGQARYFFIRTFTYFSKLQIAIGDRIQINGVKWDDATLETNPDLRDFVGWINQNEGHLVAGIGYSNSSNVYVDGANSVGYANYIIIQARYADPTTGSTDVLPFNSSATGLNTDIDTNYANQLLPSRLINQNRQLMLVFRIITREMDALPQLRPDNNY
jgi:hypothetical protein